MAWQGWSSEHSDVHNDWSAVSSVIPSICNTGDTAGDLTNFLDLLDLENPNVTRLESDEIDAEFHPHFIGQGASYRVYAGKCKRWSSIVAIKYARSAVQNVDASQRGGQLFPQDERKFVTILRELYIFCCLPKHPNVLSLLAWGHFLSEGGLTACLVTEYANEGSLKDYLQNHPASDFGLLQKICCDVVSGLSSLHQVGIVQGDIKIENVLIFGSETDGCVAKIGDFGSAIFLDQTESAPHYQGTSFCNAPEVASQHVQPIPRLSLAACDIYSLGLLVWDVFNYGDRSNRLYLFDSIKASTKEGTAQRAMGIEVLRATIIFADSNPIELHGGFLKAILEAALDPEPTSRATARKLCLMMCPDASKIDLPQAEEPSAQVPRLWTETSNSSKFTDIMSLSYRRYSWHAQTKLFQKLQIFAGNPKLPGRHDYALAVGACYAIGFGVNPDINAKIEWVKKASQFGCLYSETILQSLHLSEHSSSKLREESGSDHSNNRCFFIDYVRGLKSRSRLHKLSVHSIFKTTVHEWQPSVVKRLILENESHEGKNLTLLLKSIENPQAPLIEYPLLHYAVFQNSLDVVQQLLEIGADIDHREGFAGHTALLTSLVHQNYEAAEVLLRAGAKVSMSEASSLKPAHYLSIIPQKKLSFLAREIIRRGEPTDLITAIPRDQPENYLPFEGTPLDFAILLGRLEVVQLLLEEGSAVYQGHPTALKDGMEKAASCLYADICQLLSNFLAPQSAFPLHILGFSAVYAIDVRHGTFSKQAISSTINTLQVLGYDINAIASSTTAANGKTPLSCAVDMAPHGEDLVRALLDHGADPKVKDSDGCTPLVCAIMAMKNSRNVGHVPLLLETIAVDLTEVVPYSEALCQPLHIACDINAEGTIGIPLQQVGIDVNARDSIGQTPLHIACARNSVSVIRMLLDAGAEVNSINDSKKSPLEEAVRMGCRAAITYLLDSGVSVYNIQHPSTRSILFFTVSIYVTKTQSVTSLHLLRHERIREKGCLNWTDENGWTTLMNAVLVAEYDVVHELIKLGANTHHPPENSKIFTTSSPLWMLVAYGTSLDFSGHRKDYEDVLSALILKVQMEGNLEAIDSAGSTILHWACYLANLAAIKVLLDKGANAKGTNGLTETPLHKFVRGLIARFKNEDLPEEERSLLWYPLKEDSELETAVKDIIDLLLSFDADINARDIYGYTVLHDSILADVFSAEMAQLLLEKGACMSQASYLGETPLQMVMLEDGCERPECWRGVNYHLKGELHRSNTEKRSTLLKEFESRDLSSPVEEYQELAMTSGKKRRKSA